MKVSGATKMVEKFTISLMEENLCQKSILNFPLYTSLNSNSKACYQFNVPTKGSLELSFSINEFMIKKYVNISAEFPAQTVSIEKSDKIFN